LIEIFFRPKTGDDTTPVNRDVWDDVHDVFNNILNEDNLWHYFYEETYLIIRCQEQFVDEVIGFLKGKDYHIIKVADWVDSSPVVNLHKDLFTQMFHVNTLFAMRSVGVNYSDLYLVHDRVSHCFLNNQFLNLSDKFLDKYGRDWEVVLLTEYVHGRAKYNARYNQYIMKRNNEHNKEKGKE